MDPKIRLRVYYTLQHWRSDNVHFPSFSLYSFLRSHYCASHYVSPCCMGCFLSDLHVSSHYCASHYVSLCCMGCFLSDLRVGYFMWQICKYTLFHFFAYHNIQFIDSNYTLLLSTPDNYAVIKFRYKLVKYNVLVVLS